MIGHGFGVGGPAESWAAEHGLAAGITFVGPLSHDQVLDSLATADILVHPALEESCCMVIAEAQLAGVAVIGGAHSGGVPWQLDYNRAGRLVDVRSTSSLAGAMRELALDSATQSSLARAGADLARQRHDPERLITAIEALLDAAAHERRTKTDRTG
jgi:glycosyltransferase involved in cell wall biosynthesis